MNIRLKLCAIPLLGVLFLASQARAVFLFQEEDVCLGFRKDGSAYELTVNAGPVSKFYSAAPGATITITNFTPAQLQEVFGEDISAITWSAAASIVINRHGTKPWKTLWVCAPRIDLEKPAESWLPSGTSAQGQTAAQIDTIGRNGDKYSKTIPPGDNNTLTAVQIPSGNSFSYGASIGSILNGNYNDTFQGNVENTASYDFPYDGLPLRSDFFEMAPNKPGIRLGYFELRPSGEMVFVAASTVVVAPLSPRITRIERQGSQYAITFTTTNNVLYRLRGTNPVGLTSATSSWPILNSGMGSGSMMTLGAAALEEKAGYYIIQAGP